MAKIVGSVSDKVKNIVGKGENAGNQCFLQCFQKALNASKYRKISRLRTFLRMV